MTRHKTVLLLTLAEGFVLWSTAVVGVGFADAPSMARTPVLLGRGFAFALTCVVGLYLADLYDIVSVRRATAFSERLPRALTVALVLLALLYALLPGVRMNMATLPLSALVAFALLFPVRAALGRIVRRKEPERVLVLGGGALADSIVDAVKTEAEHVIVGVVLLAGDDSCERVSDQPMLWSAGELPEKLRAAQPDRIVVTTADRRVPLPARALLEGRLHGIAVEDGVPFYERVAGKIAIESLNPGSVAFGDGFVEARLHAAFARAVGLIAALIGLIVLSPLLLLVCVLIRLTSKGPIFFVQQRVGRQGRPFGLLKLRTMRMSKRPTSEWAGDNKHRVTPVGRWLRRYRIDELPQLINVLKGDMNLVGPRPHPVSNQILFQEKIPHYALRSVVRPGITGWAQVRHGYADNLEQEIEKMRFDLFYIRNVSIWLDLRVLLETVGVLAKGQEKIMPKLQSAVSVALPAALPAAIPAAITVRRRLSRSRV